MITPQASALRGAVRELLPYQMRDTFLVSVRIDPHQIQYSATFIERTPRDGQPACSWTFPLRQVAPEQFEIDEIHLALLALEV